MERGAKSKKDGTKKAESKPTKRKTDAGTAPPRKSSKSRDGNDGGRTARKEMPESARGDNPGGPRREKVGREDLDKPWRERIERNTEKLFEYVKKGQTHNIEEFIRLGADVNGRDEEGRTPLIRAAELRNNTVQTILMSKNVQVNATDKLKRRALHFESAHGDTDSVKQLLAHGADIDAKDCEGRTPLHYAVNRNNLSTVDILVFCGADGRVKDSKRASPESICEPGSMQTLLRESRDVIYAIRHGYISLHRTTMTSNTLVHLESIGLKIRTPSDFSKTDVSILCRRVRPEYSRCGLGPINKELLISDTFEFRLSGSRYNGKVKMMVPMYTKPEPYEEVHIKTSKNPKLQESSKELVLYEREESSNQWVCSVDIDLKEIRSFVLVTRPRVEHFRVGQQGGTFVSDVDSFIKIDIPQKSFSDKGDLTLEVIPRPAYSNEELGVKQIEVTSVSNIYEVNHTKKEQPQNEVTVTLPLPRDYQPENTKLYVLSRRNPTEHESELSLWDIVSINPDQAYGRMTFKTSHFSSELVVALTEPNSDTPKPVEQKPKHNDVGAVHPNAKMTEDKRTPQEQESNKQYKNTPKEGSNRKDESRDNRNLKTTKTSQDSKSGNMEAKDKARRGSDVSQTSNRSQKSKGSHSGGVNDKGENGTTTSGNFEKKEIETSEKKLPQVSELKRLSSASSSQTSLNKKNDREEEDTFWDDEDDENDKKEKDTSVIQKSNDVDKDNLDETAIRSKQAESELHPQDEETQDKDNEAKETQVHQSKTAQDGSHVSMNSTSQLNSTNENNIQKSNDAVDGNKKSIDVDNKENVLDKSISGSYQSLKSIQSTASNKSKTSFRKDKQGIRPIHSSQSSLAKGSSKETIEDTNSDASSISRRSQKMVRDKERALQGEVKKAAAYVYEKAKKRKCKVSFVIMLNENTKDDKYETLVECTMKDPYKRLSFWETEGFQDQKPSFPKKPSESSFRDRNEYDVIPKTVFEFPVSEAARVLELQKLEFHPKRKDDNFIRFEIERTNKVQSDALLKIMKKPDTRPDNAEEEQFGSVILHLDGIDALEKKSTEKAKTMKEFTNDSFLEKVSSKLSDEWYKIGIFLGVAKSSMDKAVKDRKFKMLRKWRDNCKTREDRGVRILTLALKRAGRRDVEEFVIKELESWLEKHKTEDDDFSKWLKRAKSAKWEVPEGTLMPYSDEFLMCLVDQLGLKEELLILLGLNSPQINNVKDSNFYPTPERQMFELLCQAKRRCGTDLEFHKAVDMYLDELDLKDVQLWFRKTTAEWCQEHETDEENIILDQLQSYLDEVEYPPAETTDKKEDIPTEKKQGGREERRDNTQDDSGFDAQPRKKDHLDDTGVKPDGSEDNTEEGRDVSLDGTQEKQHVSPENTDEKHDLSPNIVDLRQDVSPEDRRASHDVSSYNT